MSTVSLLIHTVEDHESLRQTLATAIACGDGAAVMLSGTDDSTSFGRMSGLFPTVKKVTVPGQCGIAGAMQWMFDSAGTDYVMPLPVGVMLLPGAVAALQGMLDAIPEAGAAYGLQADFDAVSQQICALEGGPIGYFRLFDNRNIAGGSIMLRRSAVAAAGGIGELEPGFSSGWDFFLYCRTALIAPFAFFPRPVGYRLWRGERDNSFHQGKDCRSTLREGSEHIVAEQCSEWFRNRHEALMRQIISGRDFSSADRLAVMTTLGLIAGMTKPGSREAVAITDIALKLAPDDYGVYWFDIVSRMKSGDWRMAVARADEMFKRFSCDCWVGRKALMLKRMVIGNAGAPADVLAAFDAASAEYLKAYYLDAASVAALTTQVVVLEMERNGGGKP